MVFLLSTYNLPNAEQWDVCRMLERAGISNFEFIALEDYRDRLDDVAGMLLGPKETPLLITLDDTALAYAQASLVNTARLIPWYRPSNHIVPPKVAGQQLANVINNKATTDDWEG